MRAVVYDEYGSPDGMRLVDDLPKPVPGDGDVILRVHATSLNGSDAEALRGHPAYVRIGGLRRPRRRVLGSDIAGIVESVGGRVTRFKPGDAVFGDVLQYLGGLAEYARAPEKMLIRKPEGMSFEVASTLPQAGVIALQGIRGRVRPGQSVLINGAGGSAGMFAIQLAKAEGAEVTGVDNAEKLDFLRSLGCDHVIDYAQEDFARSGRRYDYILDTIGTRSAFAVARALKPGGKYRVVGGPVRVLLSALFFGPFINLATRRGTGVLVVRPNTDDLAAVAELVMTGRLAPVIDRRYSFAEAPEALRLVSEGRAKGKVVVTMETA